VSRRQVLAVIAALLTSLAVPIVATAPVGAATVTAPGSYHAVTQSRLADTHAAGGVSVSVPVRGNRHLPSTGVGEVVLTLAVYSPSRAGSVTAYASGQSPSTEPSLTFDAGQTAINKVIVPVGSNGAIRLVNRSGSTVRVSVDLSGYYGTGAPIAAGAFAALDPARLLDTRTSLGGHPSALAAGSTSSLVVTDHGSVPARGVSAVALEVTMITPTESGSVSVYGHGYSAGTGVHLSYGGHATVTRFVKAAVGANGKVDFANLSSGRVHVVVDVIGYYLSAALPVPTASVSHYVRNIYGTAADVPVMHAEGCTDARRNVQAGPHLTLLDIGAQSKTKAPAGGVRLSATDIWVTYPQLVTAIEGYIDGYSACRALGTRVTIAVGTNSDGDFSHYNAGQRGADWGKLVVTPLQHHRTNSSISVIGANDIEAGFDATELQAEQWITAYLGHAAGRFVYNGSADGCPTNLGATGISCYAIRDVDFPAQLHVWTQRQYYRMAHLISPDRIVALPQIYFTTQAGQWANIDRTGGGHITFIGSLTEIAAAGPAGSFSAGQGWATLWQQLSTSTHTQPDGANSLPVATDLRIDR
jgi:hypothetical protein